MGDKTKRIGTEVGWNGAVVCVSTSCAMRTDGREENEAYICLDFMVIPAAGYGDLMVI